MKKVYKACILFVSIIILLFLIYSFFTDRVGGANPHNGTEYIDISNQQFRGGKNTTNIINERIGMEKGNEGLNISLHEDNSVKIDNKGDVSLFVQKFFGDLDTRAYSKMDLNFYDIEYLAVPFVKVNTVGLTKYVERLFSANFAYLERAKDAGWNVKPIVCKGKDFCAYRNFKIFYADSDQMFLIPAGVELPRIRPSEKKDISVLPVKDFEIKTVKSKIIFYDRDLNNITDAELPSKILFANIFVFKGNDYVMEDDANKLLDLYPVEYRKPLKEESLDEVFMGFGFVIYKLDDNKLCFFIEKQNK